MYLKSKVYWNDTTALGLLGSDPVLCLQERWPMAGDADWSAGIWQQEPQP